MSDVTFIQVGDLANGFEHASHLVSRSDELAGRTFKLYFKEKQPMRLALLPGELLHFNSYEYLSYRCTSIRESIYFIDFLDPDNPRGTITIILDVSLNLVTLIYGQLPTADQVSVSAFSRIKQNVSLTDVDVCILFGTAKILTTDDQLHHFTDELIGYRNQYIYSSTEKYEHIYLNENFYAWHCIEGVEKGLADVDRCHYIKISEKLYLFIWREKIVPTLGVILIDMKLLRTDGKILGYQEEDFKALTNFQVGSYAKILHSIV